MIVTVRRLAVLFAGVLSLLAVPDAYAAGVVVVRSQQGVVAHGVVYIDHPSAPTDVMQIRFVVPQGATVSNGSVAGVDLARPWVAVTAGSADGRAYCSTLANPARYAVGARKGDRWAGLFVDVRCNDGTGYDFYRFTWTSELWLVSNPLVTATSGGQPVAWSTDTAHGVVTAWPESEQSGGLLVCGHRAGRAPVCLGRGDGLLLLSPTGILTTGAVR